MPTHFVGTDKGTVSGTLASLVSWRGSLWQGLAGRTREREPDLFVAHLENHIGVGADKEAYDKKPGRLRAT
jgi:hypothetical protein